MIFEGEGDLDQRQLAPSMATMQFVDSTGGDLACPAFAWTASYFEKNLMDFGPLCGSDNGPFDSDITDDKADEEDGLADSSAVVSSVGDGGNGYIVEVSPTDRAAWTLSTNAAEDGTDDDKFTTDGTSTSDLTSSQTFTGEAGVIAREDTDDTTSTSACSDLAISTVTLGFSDSMPLRANIVHGCNDGSDNGIFGSDVTHDKADEDDGRADSSAVVGSFGDGDNGPVVEVSPADCVAWTLSTNAAEANSNGDDDGSIDGDCVGGGGTIDVVSYGIAPSTTDSSASSSKDLTEGDRHVEENDVDKNISAGGDSAVSFTADNESNSMPLRVDTVDGCDDGSDNVPFDSDVTDDKADEDDELADSSAVAGSFGGGDDGSVVEASPADRAAWTLSTNAAEDGSKYDNDGSNGDEFMTDSTSTSDPTTSQIFTGEAGVTIQEDSGDTTSTSACSDLEKSTVTPGLSDSIPLTADIVDGCAHDSDNDPFDSDVTDDKADEGDGRADSSAVLASFGDGDDGSDVEVTPADRGAWTLSTNAAEGSRSDGSNDDSNDKKFTAGGASTSDPTRTQTFTGEAGVVSREDTGDTPLTFTSSDLAEFIATPGFSDNDDGVADDVTATAALSTSSINVDGENSIDIGRMETSTAHSVYSRSGTSTSTISTNNRRPTMPFLPNMHAHRSTIRTSMKVGEVLTRLDSIKSADGSNTLTLGADASMLLRRSPVCPAPTYGSPTTFPPLPQCPAPLVINRGGIDDENENASVLLPASPWKLRRAARKTARKLERKERSGVTEGGKPRKKEGLVRKFLGFFGHRGVGEGVAVSAEQNGRAEYTENISSDTTSTTPAAAVDEGDNAGPETDKTRTKHGVDSAGKGRRRGGRGWFNWRTGNKGRQWDAKVDGVVEMTVSDIGGVEVTYDGAKVLSKSGPCDWEWVNRASRVLRGRKVSDNYELRVVEEGVDMCLGEHKVWGMRLPPNCAPSDEEN